MHCISGVSTIRLLDTATRCKRLLILREKVLSDGKILSIMGGSSKPEAKRGVTIPTRKASAEKISQESAEMAKTKGITIILLSISLFLQTAIAQGLNQAQEHDHEVHCSRERSRAAWQAIEEFLMPFVERESYKISSKCRLHPSNDLFRDQEEHKIHVDINEWKCGYCKKSFRAEQYLDKHFDNRHYNLLNISDGKCLADLCGALHCDFVLNSKSQKTKCNPAAAAKNRHLCESLADSCFPVHQGPSASRLHELFLRQFCDAHTCTAKQKPFPKGGKKKTSVFYLAISILTLMLLPIFYLLVYLYQRYLFQSFKTIKWLSSCNNFKALFVNLQRIEDGDPRAKKNLTSWTKSKTIIVHWLAPSLLESQD
ncbi:hypothetical protein Tsubulata_023427 [Turnera subulata]|uniref:C2H2-type domain-containing protein n=1 Tax=Turnera subulata TaxID=218843 RepID=A0A9Q0F3K0_9ROSI|nr:hypothetical protein Tsubulata_023427 [Turnera subulata]